MPRFLSIAISVFLVPGFVLPSRHISAQEKQKSSAREIAGPHQIKPFRTESSAKAKQWANSQLRRMSLDEKIGQLVSIGLNGVYLSQESDTYRALRIK